MQNRSERTCGETIFGFLRGLRGIATNDVAVYVSSRPVSANDTRQALERFLQSSDGPAREFAHARTESHESPREFNRRRPVRVIG